MLSSVKRERLQSRAHKLKKKKRKVLVKLLQKLAGVKRAEPSWYLINTIQNKGHGKIP